MEIKIHSNQDPQAVAEAVVAELRKVGKPTWYSRLIGRLFGTTINRVEIKVNSNQDPARLRRVA